MAIRTFTSALAAILLTAGASAQAAAAPSITRDSAAVGEADQLSGTADWVPALIFILAVVATLLVVAGDDDAPESP
jgi:hypothetical protein